MVSENAKNLTESVLGGSPLQIGKRYIHPTDGLIEITHGQYWGKHGLSNHWHWIIVETGESSHGYGGNWPEATDEPEPKSEPVRPEPLERPDDNRGPDGRVLPWGPIKAIHDIGDYQIVEYHVDASGFAQPSAWSEHGQVRYMPYINCKSTRTSYRSLDSALVGAVGEKREGPNGRAAMYFDRMTLDDED